MILNKKKKPCLIKGPILLTWRASFFAHGDKFPSTLVSGLPTNAPPLGFYHFHPFFTPQFSLHIFIYICRQHQQSRLSSSKTSPISVISYIEGSLILERLIWYAHQWKSVLSIPASCLPGPVIDISSDKQKLSLIVWNIYNPFFLNIEIVTWFYLLLKIGDSLNIHTHSHILFFGFHIIWI